MSLKSKYDNFINASFLGRFSRRSRCLLYINALLLLLLLLCLLNWNHYSHLLLSQQAAERWAGESEERFAQVSCFLPINSQLKEADIHTFRAKLDAKYLELAMEAPAEQSLYVDAWSARGSFTVKGEHGSAEAQAIGVGGNYFFFHPLRLRSGSYFDESDIMEDRVVLDEELAWRLFGAMELAGLTVSINNTPYIIAGVIARDDDKLTERVSSPAPQIYLSFSRFNELTESGITCYEIAAPEPLTSFVYGALEEHFPVGEGELRENNYRYDFDTIKQGLYSFGSRVLRDNGVAYPDFENAARLSENRLMLLLVIMSVLAIFPLLSAIHLIRYGWRKLKTFIKSKRVDYEENEYIAEPEESPEQTEQAEQTETQE